MASERWVWLARVKRTQGRKGEVFAEILTDFPEKFSVRRRLWLLRESTSPNNVGDDSAHTNTSDNPTEVELVNHWLHKGGIVLHFAGVDSISAAEELAGMVVAIPRSDRASLDEGDFYVSDLIGCVLVDIAGDSPRVVGEIEDVDRSAGPVAMLIVRAANRQVSKSASQRAGDDEILIPFAKDYLRRVDMEAKRLEMALPEGLVDLNDPTQS